MGDVTRLRPPTDGVTAPNTITPAEMKSLIEWLGLTKNWFAERVGVAERQVARWVDGHAPIPDRAAGELIKVWNEAAEQIHRTIATAAVNADDDGVIILHTYRVDKDYPADYPSAYHRALMCRAVDHLLMRTKYRVQIHYHEGNP